MASVQGVINLARGLAYVDSTQYTDATAIIDFNETYHNVENDISRYLDEDFYYDVQYTNLVEDQTEYILPLSTSAISGFKRIKDISIKYTNDGYNVTSYVVVTKTVVLQVVYTALTVGQTVTFVNKEGYTIGTDVVALIMIPGLSFTLVTGIGVLTSNDVLQTLEGIGYFKMYGITTQGMSADENVYRNEQPAFSPMFKIADGSIWIYPVATEDVTNGMKIYVIRDQVDLLITDTESDIMIPRQYQTFLAYGLVQKIYQRRGLLSEAQMASATYDKKRDEMMKELSNRNTGSVIGSIPPLNYLS